MNPITEREYIYRIGFRDMRPHSKGFECKCDLPNCHDRKRRAYILLDNGSRGHNTYHCFNCGANTSLKKMIEYLNPSLYEEYLLHEKREYWEDIKAGKITPAKRKDYEVNTINSITDKEYDLKLFKFGRYFIPASESPKCVAYAEKRFIPPEVFSKCYYAIHPSCPWSDMLIFPFWKGDMIYGFQGRTVDGEKRFSTFSKNESFKIYNIFNVNFDKPVYIFEAILDSFSKSNSVAMLGSDLSVDVRKMLKFPVYCFDNDKTGLNKAIKYAEAGESVLVWPNEIKAKDTNQLQMEYNWTTTQIELMISNNIKKGFGATTALKLKRLNKKW